MPKIAGFISFIFVFWAILAVTTVLCNHHLPISYLTTMVAMFVSGSVMLFFTMLSFLSNGARTKGQKMLDVWYICVCTMFAVGYFIYCFMIFDDTWHECCRIILNAATMLCLILIASQRFLIAKSELKGDKDAA